MLNVPSKYRSQHLNESEGKIYREFQKLAAVVDAYSQKTSDMMLTLLKNEICDRIDKVASIGSGISAADEELFDQYSRLIGYYEETLSLYTTLRPQTASKRSQELNAVCGALNERVRKYYDAKLEFMAADNNENPIAAEKKEITAKCLRTFHKNFEQACARFMVDDYNEIITIGRRNMVSGMTEQSARRSIEDFTEYISGKRFQTFYLFYRDTAFFASAYFSDVTKRRVASYFAQAVKDEHAFISDCESHRLARVSALSEALPPGSEKDSLTAILKTIKEAHQYTASQMKESSNPENDSTFGGMSFELESEADFCAEMRQFLLCDSTFGLSNYETFKDAYRDAYSLFYKSIVEMLDELLDAETGKGYTKKTLFQMNRESFTYNGMAREMREIFSGLSRYMEERSGELDASDCRDIVAGIRETVTIKIESLLENSDHYALSAEKYLSDFSAFEAEIQETDRDNLLEMVINAIMPALSVLSNSSDERKACSQIKAAFGLALSGDLFQKAKESALRQKNQCFEGLKKTSYKFLRDCLLFEVGTFEEIVHYSVSRLRESTNEAVIGCVGEIDKLSLELDGKLRRFDIETIRPAPHEMFNGKEHEVLMAEKNDDYKKGEIIKVMNSGYKQNGSVITRANVIAAK